MSDPPGPRGRHLSKAAPSAAWELLVSPAPDLAPPPSGGTAVAESAVESDPPPVPPPTVAPAATRVPDRGEAATGPGGRRDRGRAGAGLARLRSDLLDRLPPVGQRITVSLGRHWWLPVVVAVAALAFAVGAVVRARPVAALPTSSTVSGTARFGVGSASAPATTARATTATPAGSSAAIPAAVAAPPPESSAGASAPGSGVGPAAVAAASTAVPTPARVPSTTPAAVLTVDVTGRVRRPGVVRLSAGTRVVDALHAAGGALPGTDLTPLNLAEPLVDGSQIRVGLTGPPVVGPGAPAVTPTESVGPVGSPTAPTSAPGSPIDVNTASAEKLDELPGIGPVLAQRIVAWRTAHGAFASVDDLDEVSGIGAATLAKFRSMITVAP